VRQQTDVVTNLGRFEAEYGYMVRYDIVKTCKSTERHGDDNLSVDKDDRFALLGLG